MDVRRRPRPARAPGWSLFLAVLLSLSVATDALAITWSGNQAIAGAGSGYASPGALAVSSSTTAHVVYEQAVLGTWGVYYRRSADSGTTWGTPVQLSRASIGDAGAPNVYADGSSVDVVWLESDDIVAGVDTVVMYRRSSNAGATWTSPVALTPALESAGMARVARRGSLVIVTWTNEVDGRVYARVSADGGATWKARVPLATTTRKIDSGLEAFPAVALGTDVAYVAYYSGTKTLQVRRSTTGGATWANPVTLSTAGSGWYPSIAASGSSVMVGYATTTATDTWSVIRRSVDKGMHWETAKDLGAQSSALSFSPIVTVRGSRWMAAFERCTSNSCDFSDAYYRASTDGGATWSTSSKASARKRTWETPVGVDVATTTLVVYIDDGETGADVYVRQGR